MSRRYLARRRPIHRKGRLGGYQGWAGELRRDEISGLGPYPEEIMVRQCGLWRRRGYQHGTHDRVDPIDDPCPMPSAAAQILVSVEAIDAAADEGGDTGTFRITRVGNLSQALVVYFGLSGTADLGTDYTSSHIASATIPAGASTVDVTITPIADAVSDDEETVILSIALTSYGPLYDIDWDNYQATVTITEDEVEPG